MEIGGSKLKTQQVIIITSLTYQIVLVQGHPLLTEDTYLKTENKTWE